jgi:hypothetical protein
MKSFKIGDFCLSTMVQIKAEEIFAVLSHYIFRLAHGTKRYMCSTSTMAPKCRWSIDSMMLSVR